MAMKVNANINFCTHSTMHMSLTFSLTLELFNKQLEYKRCVLVWQIPIRNLLSPTKPVTNCNMIFSSYVMKQMKEIHNSDKHGYMKKLQEKQNRSTRNFSKISMCVRCVGAKISILVIIIISILVTK